ncbi:YfiR family protein [Chryseolinea soli]|uniref:YfiR family protein n=1 Tax=Chryseolinea soli TaxID=2321403 RepID=A0A385SF63_9BACT|nr:YfiR family protein [Chryseolinea soli]AYB29081.1 YfiR family protein [Chryseolinea soli]
MSFLKIIKYPEAGRSKANVWLILFAGLLSFGAHAPSQGETSKEYQVKAVFLYNFTQFIEWPPDAFDQPDAPLVIGILGPDPFGKYLDETVQGEKVNGHPLVVQRFHTLADVAHCQILFISTDEKNQWKQIFEYAKARHVLTVGDVTNFSKQGGMIRFFPEENKIRIRINLTSVKNADLKVSSKLLRLAEIVEP